MEIKYLKIKINFYHLASSRFSHNLNLLVFIALALLHSMHSIGTRKFIIYDFRLKDKYDQHTQNRVVYRYSIVIISFNRTKCLQRAFNQIYYEEKLSKDTEILIVDDNTTNITHIEYFSGLSKLPRVTVIINLGYHGAFYNKLFGYHMALGKYILTCDDDDIAEVGYYKELIDHIEDRYDIIYPFYTVYTKRRFLTIEDMIVSFHNLYNVVFRKELMISAEYPKLIPIRRDDAPILIPMYMKTDISKINTYQNKYKYKIGNKFCDKYYTHKHQSYYFKEQEYVRNGMMFLINYAEKQNKSHFIPSIRRSYKGYLKSYLK